MAERLFQKGAEIAAGDGAGAKAGQVGGLDLAVDEVESPLLQMRDQGDEGRLGGVGDRGEHRFAEEGAAEGNAIDAADEFLLPPDLDGVGEAEVVQDGVGLPHFRRDPGAVLTGSGPPAGGDHLPEGLVECNPDESLFQELPHAPRDAQFVREQDETGVRRPPEDGFAVAVPGEDPLPVGGEQPLWREIAADGEKTAFCRLPDRGEGDVLRKSVNRHG